MIKKTLYFGNPAYLSLRQQQMVIKLPEVKTSPTLPKEFKSRAEVTKPIEDIGIVVLDNRRITITQCLLEALLENNCAVITCDSHSMPVGMMLPLCGNTVQCERFRTQIEASLPLKKQLWQQTMKAKISNQASVLAICTGNESKTMLRWAGDVKSGDPDNIEGRAAAHYWKSLFKTVDGLEDFTRDRDGELSKDIKAKLLSIPTLDVVIGGKRSPLMVGVSQTTASLYRCFSGESRKIAYPEIS